ncbi:GFA family protein [Pseudoalteromonas sp. L23]|uniref:GFA family protein n=1 Tax=Pseudoalteromonas TaxID=53246 RepID=UPI00029B21C5|nr:MULTISPECIES: GFA family protein [Pseudoalteromonas]MCF7513973.1 GFA family protein [Pseudoalteromonas sp. L7]MCF7526273.1 GFA family protein [Pseudoalteromonas sp. L23]MCG7555694.1 GFA family protein [Pseudoalteromonas sp. Of11M-6]
MKEMFAGSCLCGQVKYLVEGNAQGFYLCHCEYCQKDTGSAHAANLFFQNAVLTWLAGEKLITRFILPNTKHVKAFCTCCGSALPNQQPVGLVVPAGSLDDAPSLTPTAHLFIASKAKWDEKLEQVLAFETLPRD